MTQNLVSQNVEDICLLKTSIDQSNLRRAADLSMAEKFKLGADLYDDGIRWLKKIIKGRSGHWGQTPFPKTQKLASRGMTTKQNSDEFGRNIGN